MMEWSVYSALLDSLSPLAAFGFTFALHRDGVFIATQGVSRTFTAQELFEDGDPCGLVLERFGL